MAFAGFSAPKRAALALTLLSLLDRGGQVSDDAWIAGVLCAAAVPHVKTLKHNWELSLSMGNDEFKLWYRVSIPVFNCLVGRMSQLEQFMTPLNIGTRTIDVARQVAIYLYRFGNADMAIQKVCSWFDVGVSTVMTASMRVASAMPEAFPDAIHYALAGPEKASQMADFAAYNWGGLRAIIDCSHIKITVDPGTRKRDYEYTNRHDLHVLSYQFICDAKMRFLDIFGGYGGRCNDQMILNESPFAARLGEVLQVGEWLMADMGYALKEWCISGFRANEISGANAAERLYFNRIFSSMRITIERAFGVLKSRFRSLMFGLNFRERASYSIVILSLCIVHNICIEYRDAVTEAEITAGIEADRTVREALRRAAAATAAAAAAAGAPAAVPVVHAATLAAGRTRRKAIASLLVGDTGYY